MLFGDCLPLVKISVGGLLAGKPSQRTLPPSRALALPNLYFVYRHTCTTCTLALRRSVDYYTITKKLVKGRGSHTLAKFATFYLHPSLWLLVPGRVVIFWHCFLLQPAFLRLTKLVGIIHESGYKDSISFRILSEISTQIQGRAHLNPTSRKSVCACLWRGGGTFC